MSRRLAREVALKALFAKELGKNDPFVILEQLLKEDVLDRASEEFARQLVEGTVAKQQEIDSIIKKYALEWELERMAGVDRNLMRLALYEIFYTEDVPFAVATNEAVEMAKVYGSDESARFINGIIGKIIKYIPEIKAELV